MAYVPEELYDLNTTGSVDLASGTALLVPSSTGATIAGTEENPLKVAIASAQTVPVSGPLTDAQLRAASIATTDSATTAINTAIGAQSDNAATSAGSFSLQAFIKAFYTFIKGIYDYLSPKQQAWEIQTISASATVAVGSSSFLIYRPGDAGTVEVQGATSILPTFSLESKKGISGTVVNPRDTLVGVTVTISNGASVNVITLKAVP